MKDNRKKRKRFLPIWFLLIALLIGGCGSETESRQTDAITQQTLTETADTLEETQEQRAVVASDETESAAKTQDEITDYATEKSSVLTMDEIPAFADAPYVVIDDNEPDFQENDYSETSYEYYSDLDELGRCGVAVSNIGKDLMPTKKRGSIGKVKPSGWHTVKYDFVDGKYLYNRCHLIGYQLTAENANEKNLITGTRYMNVDGMLPFENMVADYVNETKGHVLYRVTPVFYQDELVERDDEKAFYWYGKAYAAGIKEAALPLARLYLRPSDEQDTVRAEKLLREAAGIETDGQASLALGNIYRDGLNGEIDMKQAVSWYEKGASQGNPECMEILGCLYFQGEEGVDRDYAKAFEWLNRCEEAGSLQSASKLGYLYMKGEGCTADENKAKELFERAAQTECDGYALYELGFIYERKNESPEDLERAAQCYQKAIEMGNESASRRFSHFKKGLFGRWKITY